MKQVPTKQPTVHVLRRFPALGVVLAIIAIVLAVLFMHRAFDTGSLLQYAIALVLVGSGVNYLGQHIVGHLRYKRNHKH